MCTRRSVLFLFLSPGNGLLAEIRVALLPLPLHGLPPGPGAFAHRIGFADRGGLSFGPARLIALGLAFLAETVDYKF